MKLVWLGCTLWAILGGAATVPTAARSRLSYEHDVRPILARHCFECHGPDTQESGSG